MSDDTGSQPGHEAGSDGDGDGEGGADRRDPFDDRPTNRTDDGPITAARATLHVRVSTPEAVAAAVRPDDTPEIRTRVEGPAVVCTIERDSVGGLAATVDDAVVNLRVAAKTAQLSDSTTVDDHNDDSNHEPRGHSA